MYKDKMSEADALLVTEAYALLDEYRSAYAAEWRRLERNERLYRGDHWHDCPVTDPNEPRPVTPILQSTVESVAADLMEQLPAAVVCPESAADANIARIVEAVIARNHDEAAYVLEYQKLVHDLLVCGWCVQEVGYDSALNGGLGGAFLRAVEPRAILVDPLAAELQDGRAILKLTLRSHAYLAAHWPKEAPFLTDEPRWSAYDAPADELLPADRSDALLLLEYWWREHDAALERDSVHMALLCGGRVLEDSRREKPEGYFAHGRYPFVMTTLFPRKGSALGLGLIDLFAEQQLYADKLDQIVMKNAVMASHNKLLVTEGSGFDADDLADWSKEVHRGESLSGVSWFSTPPLPAYLINYIRELRESIKEESGANDSSRGSVPANVTAARAITALQEASTKRARMASARLNEAFRQAVRLEIETEREFNLFLRPVTVTIDGKPTELVFDSSLLTGRSATGASLPIEFYISVKLAKQSRFAAEAQNELILQLLKAGAVEPRDAVELMHFDGKEQLLARLKDAGEAAATKKGAVE